MQFFKDNLFYSSLVTILVVVGGTLVALGFRGNSATDAKQAPIESMSDRIARLDSTPYVNERVITARGNEVTRTEALLRQTAINTAKWSRGDGRRPYAPMILPKHGEGGERIGTIAAFPIDRDLYKKYDLPYYGSGEYRTRMGEVFRRLHPALAPTGEELEAEADRLKAIVDENARRRKLREDFEKRKALVKEGDTGTGAEPEAGREPAPETARDERGLTGEATTQPVEEDYVSRARNNMRLFKAGLSVKGKPAPETIKSVFSFTVVRTKSS